MNILDRFELSQGEKMHPLWYRLKAQLEKDLQALRERNDRPQDEMETATLRGHIKALRAIIALGDDRPDTTGE